MWSPPGSGFEASNWSPAGRAQAQWRAVRGWNSMSPYRRAAAVRAFLKLVLAGLGVVALVSILAAALSAVL